MQTPPKLGKPSLSPFIIYSKALANTIGESTFCNQPFLMSSSQECGTSIKLALKRWPFLRFFFSKSKPICRPFSQIYTVSQPFSVCLSSLALCRHLHVLFFNISHTPPCLFQSLSLSLSRPHAPPVFPDTVRRQSCGLMVTWLCGVYCIVRQLPALPSAVLTVLSWMNEHSVLTRGATVSNNKSLLSSVKFCTLLDLVSLLGLW